LDLNRKELTMWRAFFLATGAYCCLLGAQCLAIDKAILSSSETTQTRILGMGIPSTTTERNKELAPPDWAPWSLLSLGAVTVLYSFTIPNRGK
jgi:hypothetical protein